jgi:hypothetical protein
MSPRSYQSGELYQVSGLCRDMLLSVERQLV